MGEARRNMANAARRAGNPPPPRRKAAEAAANRGAASQPAPRVVGVAANKVGAVVPAVVAVAVVAVAARTGPTGSGIEGREMMMNLSEEWHPRRNGSGRRIGRRIGRQVRGYSLALAMVLGLSTASWTQAQTAAGGAVFATPEAALSALATAAQANDKAALLGIFGAAAGHLVASGDDVADRNARAALLQQYAARHSLQPQPDGSVVLVIGNNDWPFPIPLVRDGAGWRFDTQRGMQELIDRRVGRNELSAIALLRQAVVAQADYSQRMNTEFGIPAYATRLISTPGTHDGLIWDNAEGEALSPLGAQALQQEAEGYPDAHIEIPGHPVPYHGYYFRMLTSQGPNARGAPGSYIRNGYMTGGFAMVAWPAHYGASGIMTFIVSHDGVVFQRNFGEATPQAVARIVRFDPDANWQVVPEGGK